MKKQRSPKLTLTRETLSALDRNDPLARAHGAALTINSPTCLPSCNGRLTCHVVSICASCPG
jgi:hypothetical protein